MSRRRLFLVNRMVCRLRLGVDADGLKRGAWLREFGSEYGRGLIDGESVAAVSIVLGILHL